MNEGHNTTKIVGVVVAIVIVGALIFFGVRSKTSQPTTPNAAAGVEENAALKAQAEALNPIKETTVNPYEKPAENPYESVKTNPFE